MLSVTVTVSGNEEAIAKLKKVGQSFYQFSSAMKSIGEELGSGSKGYFPGQVFASRGSVLGQQWAPLSPRYQTWKKKHYDGAGQNILTHTTQRSFAYEANDTSVVVYNKNEEIFEYLQLGTRKMPARPMIGVNNDVQEIIRKVIDADIKQKIAKAGL